MTPETSGQAALVPSNSSLHPPSAVVVICMKAKGDVTTMTDYTMGYISSLRNNQVCLILIYDVLAVGQPGVGFP